MSGHPLSSPQPGAPATLFCGDRIKTLLFSSSSCVLSYIFGKTRAEGNTLPVPSLLHPRSQLCRNSWTDLGKVTNVSQCHHEPPCPGGTRSRSQFPQIPVLPSAPWAPPTRDSSAPSAPWAPHPQIPVPPVLLEQSSGSPRASWTQTSEKCQFRDGF